ncbi:LacI family transcriptional regulator [Devosia sp. BK]|uniref:LacI family DNA-binding transcriptional regulator n=1 Tax=Devosia sp. BK TaxID=2871706 RepID=UPI002939C9FA|nr:LacI family DNA-binding transcriptional regulator [Devosia sp. BK]MDV3252763.1 LacI family transcriptional regulator [Devosia sp. BK]
MPTLSDVAAEAGVSPTAVSRYLNNRIDLPQATRDRIDAAIAKLDYRPNLLARRLSTGKSEAIALVTPDIANPFFAELAAAVERQAHASGYSVYITSTQGHTDAEVKAIRRMADSHVDGLIMMTNRVDDGTLAALLAGRTNVVVLDEDIEGVNLPRVFVDNAEGAYLATRHLIEHGHRDIALIGGPHRLMSVNERLAGYNRAMDEAGFSIRPGWVLLGDYSRDYGAAAASVLLEAPSRPTAILACSDYIAIGVIQTVRALGFSIPNDISLVGFDDMAFAALVDPPLTTIRQPVGAMGELAVKHLLALLEGTPPPDETRLPVELVIRNSVAPPAQHADPT